MTPLAWIGVLCLVVGLALVIGCACLLVRAQRRTIHLGSIPEEHWQYLPNGRELNYFTPAEVDAAEAKYAAKMAGTVGL